MPTTHSHQGIVLYGKMAFTVILALFMNALSASAQLSLDLNIGLNHKLVECRHGTFIINKRDSWVGRSLDVYGEWAEIEIQLLKGFLEEGDVVADVGANVGSFAVPLAKAVGSSGKVVAFEAQRVLTNLLSANLALNELTNVGVYNAGVGDSSTPLEVPDVIYTDEANFGSISLLVDWKGKGAGTSLVPQVRLDDVFADQCPSLIKVDVEGMELMVLRGAEQTMKKCQPVLYIENNCRTGSKALIDFVTSLGYNCHWHVSPYFSETNFRQHEAKIFPESVNSINMLCYSGDNPKARTLPSITRIDASIGYELHEYNLSYTRVEGVALSQESCER